MWSNCFLFAIRDTEAVIIGYPAAESWIKILNVVGEGKERRRCRNNIDGPQKMVPVKRGPREAWQCNSRADFNLPRWEKKGGVFRARSTRSTKLPHRTGEGDKSRLQSRLEKNRSPVVDPGTVLHTCLTFSWMSLSPVTKLRNCMDRDGLCMRGSPFRT